MSPLPTKKRLLTEDDLLAAIGDAINLSAYYQKSDFEEGLGIRYSRLDGKLIISVNEATMPAGKSAYELWLNQFGNTEKSLQEFFDSLKGAKGEPGETGATGKSAYQSWQELNPSGTLEDFFLSIKGTEGLDGQPGSQGPQGVPGPAGPAGQNGAAGQDGKSLYQLWLEDDDENVGTFPQFLQTLRGADGKSADQLWTEWGNTGTLQEFFESLIAGGGSGGNVDLSNYYNKAEVDELIEAIPSGGGNVDLSNYYNKAEVDELIEAIPSGGGSCSCGQGVSFYTEQEMKNMLIRTGFREGQEIPVEEEPADEGGCTCGMQLEFYTQQEIIEMTTRVGFREAV
jgi:hypothetical protein